MNSTTILIAEKDNNLLDGMRTFLSHSDYNVLHTSSGKTCMDLFHHKIDLVILSVELPDISGFDICKRIRNISNIPILLLSDSAYELNKFLGFESGSDDYLSKPFTNSELLIRIKSLLRRYRIYNNAAISKTNAQYYEYLETGCIKINLHHNEVLLNGVEINLPRIEYDILLLLMKNPGRVFSTKYIYESIWNEPYFYHCSNTVTVHIRKLRLKIEEDIKKPKYIHTVWGKGYKFYEAEKNTAS